MGFDNSNDNGPDLDLADIERSRKSVPKTAAPPTQNPRGIQKAARRTQQTKVSIRQRVLDYPAQGLRDSAGALYCTACKTTLQNLKSTIDVHLTCKKHITNLHKITCRAADDDALKQCMTEYFNVNSRQHMVRGCCIAAIRHRRIGAACV